MITFINHYALMEALFPHRNRVRPAIESTPVLSHTVRMLMAEAVADVWVKNMIRKLRMPSEVFDLDGED